MVLFQPIMWLIVFVVLLVFEIMTLGLTSIWFAGGALLAFVAAMIGANGLIQVLVFLVVSLLLLFTVKPLAGKFFNHNREKTNIDALIGKQGVVTVEINNLDATGEINLEGHMWTARSESGEVIEEKANVEVVKIEGVKAIVKRV